MQVSRVPGFDYHWRVHLPGIRRDRTAMRRHQCSRPIAAAVTDGLITRETDIFDYGCGHGGDVRYLKARGFTACGWDPHHRPKGERGPADVVNLGYVLNVIEDPGERAQVLHRAFDLARRLLVVAVRVDQVPDTYTEWGDGYLTAHDTFQKLYSQAEFRAYVEEQLGARAHIASFGIAYVFKDAELEARHLANRAFTRRLEYRTDLIEAFGRNPAARKLVTLAQKLGRVPHPDEFDDYEELEEAFGSRQRIERLLLRTINPEAFEGSREQRREDLLTFLAMLPLQGLKTPKLKDLAPSLRRDLKAIWPSYAEARKEALAFLYSLGQPDTVRAACNAATVGKRLPEDLYVHPSAEDELPALLRVLLFATRRIVGNVACDLVKIATDGRAVSFLKYASFDDDPHPRLLESVRVYLPRTSYSIRTYGQSSNPPILHRKETFVGPDYPYRERFAQLTAAEEAAGLLSSPDVGRRREWEQVLLARGYRIDGHQLVAARC